MSARASMNLQRPKAPARPIPADVKSREVWRKRLFRAPVTPIVKVIGTHVAGYVNSVSGLAWPGATRLAEECGVTERCARSCLTALVAAGFLVVEPQHGRGNTNRYRLTLPEEVQAAVPPEAAQAARPAQKASAVGENLNVAPRKNLNGGADKTCTDAPIKPERPFREAKKEYRNIKRVGAHALACTHEGAAPVPAAPAAARLFIAEGKPQWAAWQKFAVDQGKQLDANERHAGRAGRWLPMQWPDTDAAAAAAVLAGLPPMAGPAPAAAPDAGVGASGAGGAAVPPAGRMALADPPEAAAGAPGTGGGAVPPTGRPAAADPVEVLPVPPCAAVVALPPVGRVALADPPDAAAVAPSTGGCAVPPAGGDGGAVVRLFRPSPPLTDPPGAAGLRSVGAPMRALLRPGAALGQRRAS